ncbi:MAG: hypothetical protein QXX77_06145 [Candidatus Methanosuratincola sp.]|jgi:hypothetical protein
MKATRLRISVSQDGLLPEETAEVATVPFPSLPKKIIKALGFERVDADTFVGVVPVFIKLGDEQVIEIELGVDVPEMRKTIIELVKSPHTFCVPDEPAEDGEEAGNVINIKPSPQAKKPPRGRKKDTKT